MDFINGIQSILKARQFRCTDLFFLCTGKEVQAIWKNLIDTYRKKSKSGSAGDSIEERASQWRYYDRMNFLKTFIGGKKYAQVEVNKIN